MDLREIAFELARHLNFEEIIEIEENPLIMIFTNVPKMKSVRPIVEKLENMSKHSLTPPKKENIATYQSHISAKDLSFSYDGKKRH